MTTMVLGSSLSLPTVVGTVVVGLLVALYAFHYRVNVACRRYCKSTANLEGKTVIVTGANSGIGKVTALDLARRGARVILACRSLQKAEDAAREIRTRTGNAEVVVRHLDLSSLASVRQFARAINESEHRLDILINNAGIADVRSKNINLTEDSFHRTFGTNHFGHFLLTHLLLDLLKKSAPSRVVTVSSVMHATVPRPLDLAGGDQLEGVPGPVRYPRLRSYSQSKLANVLFAAELARRLTRESAGVASVSLHPGVIYTPIWRALNVNDTKLPVYTLFRPLFWLFMIDEEAGAQTTLHCALDESVPRLSGRYFANCAEAGASALARDEEAARRLWDVSCHATGLMEKG